MIHPTAVIDPNAVIGEDVEIGPFCYVGPEVKIGDRCILGPHVVVEGPTTIGEENRFFQFCSIGADCQDKKYHGEVTKLEIGARNSFREGSTVHRGTEGGGGVTIIGDDNLFMVNTHVAHDCIVGNHVVFSNGASIAGHVRVDNYASLGGFVGVHQFCVIGEHSFSAGGTIIFKDVMPFVKVSGHPASAFGLNNVGLERRNFSGEEIKYLKQAYKIIFRTSATVKEAIQQLDPLVKACQRVSILQQFLQNSPRGIIR